MAANSAMVARSSLPEVERAREFFMTDVRTLRLPAAPTDFVGSRCDVLQGEQLGFGWSKVPLTRQRAGERG